MKKNLSMLCILLLFNLPLMGNSSWGVEVNPIRTLLLQTLKIDSFSGGVNYFNDAKDIEIAFPLTYNKVKYENNSLRYYDHDDTSITADIHYRKILTTKAPDVYVGAFGRYTYLEGKVKEGIQIAKLHKFGLGTEVGIRVRHPNSPIYMGVSISGGVYLNDNNDIFKHDHWVFAMDDRKYFWDMELFKIGYEF